MCRGFGDPVEGGLSAGDFVEDLVGGFGPDEGLGLSFQWETLQSIRVSSSATEVKLVLVKALRLRTENQHSTRLRHDELVGVKCRCQRRRFLWASQSRTGWLLWADRLSKMRSERGLRGGAARPRRPARRAVLGHRVQRVIHDRFHNIVAEHNRAATPRPDAPHRSGSSAANRLRHRRTDFGVDAHRRAISAFEPPSVAHHNANNALAWRTSRAGAVCERASRSSAARCPPVISNAPAAATIPPTRQQITL